jgi:hypothetical protein
MVAGYRCSVFGIAVVDATVRTNVVIATALFTGAFGQQDFINRDHNTASNFQQLWNTITRRGGAGKPPGCTGAAQSISS